MDINTRDEKDLRKYLLGDMPPEKQEEIELWLMSDEKAYDFLVASEDDLVDDFLAGNLKPREIERFERHFLTTPERQHKLQFGRVLKQFIERTNPGTLPLPKPAPFWQAAVELFRYRPARGYAFAIVAAVLLIGGFWSFLRVAELGRKLDSTSNQLSYMQQEREEFKRQLGQSQSLRDNLQAQLRTLEQAFADSKISTIARSSLALMLTPGLPRSSNRPQLLTISENTSMVHISLALLDGNYESYRVTLLDAGNKELWTRYRLTATAIGQDKFVVVNVPGELLSPGNYSLRLEGTSESQPPENINNYYFHVVVQ
jgi:hypothetical protein